MSGKIGIVSCYFKHNYGSMLQAYATQKVLDNMGIENETFNITDNVDFKNGKAKYYKSQIFNFKFIKSKFGMIKLKIDKKTHRKLGKNIAIRDKKYNDFVKEIRLTRPQLTYEELNENAKRYSSIIVGSDQLWLPVNVVADYYTLNWVPEEINKVSYATSFGISQIPDQYKEMYKKFLKRINYISVREDKGCEIVKNLIDKEAKLVCDPTMLLTREEWLTIQEKEPIIKGDYIFCYFLGNNIEHRKFAERLKEKTGYKIVSLNHADEYVKYSDKFADIIPYDVGPKEFLNLLRKAKYVCTDSFHGTVFSLINNVEFFTFERFKNKNSKMSTNSRIYSLLGLMNLKNRLLKGNESIEELIENKINFADINKNLEKIREESKEFLKEALKISIEEQEKEKKNKYIKIEDKSLCCGCTACKNICPQNAIEMEEDKEGFLYPIINKEKCINCGLCRKVCPVLQKNKKVDENQKGYIVYNKDYKIRKESTSGGAFSAIAGYVLNNDGIVFGACIDKEHNVYHKYVNRIEELKIFRGSKYVQSNLKNTFNEAKQFLDIGKMVCFSGTPCQIAGLKSFLNREYSNLITVDVVCRAVPSPLVLRKYLEYQKKKLNVNEIKEIIFRDKSVYGYNYSVLTIKADNKNYHNGIDTDPYLRAFFSNISVRPSCYNCKFRTVDRVSDFTIWDCYNSEKFDRKFDDNKGTTRILLHNNKAIEIFNQIKNGYDYKEVEVANLIADSKELQEGIKGNIRRKQFFEDIENLGETQLFEKYFPNTVKVRIEKISRRIFIKFKFYKKLKNFMKNIIKTDRK